MPSSVLFFDPPAHRLRFLPFSFTRPLAHIRVGIMTIAEKWTRQLGAEASFLTAAYLSEKYPAQPQGGDLYLHGLLLPSPALLEAVSALGAGQALWHEGLLLAARPANPPESPEALLALAPSLQAAQAPEKPWLLEWRWDIFLQNKAAILADFRLLTAGRKSQPIADPHTVVYGTEVFLEEGAQVRAAVLNALNGPIYLGKNAVVHEGSLINGAFALCEGAHVNMGAKIKGDTTVGPFSKVGGEVSNSVVFGYSNKAHDGFIGNTVVGEWCNLGADTNTSNLKNNYAEVKLWDYEANDYTSTGQQFCGTMMGDHGKCGINTMLNTGTVMGVCANVFGADFQKQFVPSFSWGNRRYATFQLDKAFEVAERVMARRQVPFTEADRRLLAHVFEITEPYRK